MRKEWKTDLEKLLTKECSETSTPTVVIGMVAQAQINSLMKEITDSEWMGHLVGSVDNGKIIVEEVIIPEQEADRAYCESKAPEPEGCIGVIHSHHTMGTFFSGIDHDGVNMNNLLSIVVAKTGETVQYKANVRMTTPCGKIVFKEATVVMQNYVATEEWVKEAKEKIKKRTYSHVASRYGVGYGYGYDYLDDYADIGTKKDEKNETKSDTEKDTDIESTIKKIKESETFDLVEVTCPMCGGTGVGVDDELCETCHGWGIVYAMPE